MEKNARRLYEHFKKVGKIERVDAILKAYPHFAEEEKEKPKKK